MQAIPASVEDHVQQDSPVNFTPVNETPPPKLVLWQGVALLTADCLGVGVLALPNDVRLLGYTMGLTFLILNLPINYYAGDLLSVMALQLEGGATSADFDLTLHEEADSDDEKELELPETFSRSSDSIDPERSLTMFHRHSKSLPSYGASSIPALSQVRSPPASFQDETLSDHTNVDEDHQVRVIQKTNDLIEISKAIFDSPRVTHLVVMIYYLNLFLVLGDYILVMGRAVSAMFLDQICLPMAGVIASLFMFAICQLRTMAHLGRNVSVASLLAMLVVLLQCLFHHRTNAVLLDTANQEESTDIWAKFSALASIGFAVGSQKLFLNIRNELQTKEDASKVLAGSLTTYGSAYVLVILLAGSNPPSFLFDSIPEGWSRRIAGFLLWGHVAVSYSINSQALCSSMDQFFSVSGKHWEVINPRTRWFFLTLTVTISSYLVSNAIPFFKDLVALIGALTSVPLTLTLPALLHRKFHRLWLLFPNFPRRLTEHDTSWGSYSLILYSLAFFVVGLIGAMSSIGKDWSNHGRPFSCR